MTDALTATPTADTAAESVLSAAGISHRYGELSVLQSVDVDVPSGAVTAVIGPNGTGKTTLLRILLGQLSPTEGSVEYTGPAVDRPIGYLPQQPSFRPQFTAAETLAFYGALLGREVDTHTAKSWAIRYGSQADDWEPPSRPTDEPWYARRATGSNQ